MNLLDWRLRRHLRRSGLPDLPEVRKLMRLAWWNGFTFGALQHQADAARTEALEALAHYTVNGGSQGSAFLPARERT